jgi:outer membrane usher protein
MSPKVKFCRKNIFVILAVACSGQAFGEEYYFDPSLLQGTAYGQGMASVNGPDTPAGEYLVDVMVNGSLLKSGVKIRFNPANGGQRTEPCLPLSLMQAAQVKSLPDKALKIAVVR